MLNPESVLENEMHKPRWKFEIQTDHLISARRPDLVIVKKKKENLPNRGICRPGWPQSKIERRQKEGKVPRRCSRIEKTMEHECGVDSNCNRCARHGHQRIGTEAGELGNKKTSVDRPNYSIFEIGKNTMKSPGDLGRIAVTLRLQWKAINQCCCEKFSNEHNNNNNNNNNNDNQQKKRELVK